MFAACFVAHMVLSTIVFMAQVPVLQTTVFALAAGGGAALFWALTFAFFQPYGMIGYVTALLLISFPPIGMLMFLNPLDVAGALFPGWEIFGIVLTGACCVILYFRPCLFVVIAVLLAHCAVTLVSIEQVKSRTAMLFKDGHVHGKPLNADVKEKQLPYERMFQVYPHFFAALGGTKRVVVTDVPARTKNARRYDLYLLKKHVNSRLYSAAYVEK